MVGVVTHQGRKDYGEPLRKQSIPEQFRFMFRHPITHTLLILSTPAVVAVLADKLDADLEYEKSSDWDLRPYPGFEVPVDGEKQSPTRPLPDINEDQDTWRARYFDTTNPDPFIHG